MASKPRAMGSLSISSATSAAWTIWARRSSAGSFRSYLRIIDSKEQRPSWCPSSTAGASKGIAPVSLATLSIGESEFAALGHKQKLGLVVDEAAEEPGTGDTVNVNVRAGNPLHSFASCWDRVVSAVRPAEKVRDGKVKSATGRWRTTTVQYKGMPKLR